MEIKNDLFHGSLLLVFSVADGGVLGKIKGGSGRGQGGSIKAKTTLASVKTEMEAALSKLQTEKDGLAAQIKTLTSDLDKVKADLAAAVKDRDGLQEQIKKLTGDQAGAVAEAQKKSQTLIEELKAQLAALTTKFTTYAGRKRQTAGDDQGPAGKAQECRNQSDSQNVRAAGSDGFSGLPRICYPLTCG